jgi:hypothetical protein
MRYPLLCRPLCWGRTTAYVHHRPHTVLLWGRACSQSPEHTLTCTVFSHFAIYLKVGSYNMYLWY